MYLETMEKILPSIQKYVVESDGKGGILNVLNLQKPLGRRKLICATVVTLVVIFDSSGYLNSIIVLYRG